MTRITLFLCLIFILLNQAVDAQIFKPKEDEIPKTYWKELDRSERKEVRDRVTMLREFRKIESGNYDIIIPEVPLPVPEGMVMAGGNTWYRDYLQASDYEDTLNYRGTFVMAILDTGEPDHKGVVKYKYPGAVSKSYTGEAVVDGHSHGTHVAGEQVYADETDVMGVVQKAAEAGHFYQMYYKVCTNSGGCAFSWMASAIRDHTAYYLANLKPKGIHSGITMSIGGSSISSDVEAAMKAAEEAGMLVFASAGNNGQPNLSFPAQSKYAQAIAAHDRDGKKAGFSNWGSPTEDLFATAPGVGMYSTCKGDSKCFMNGTSMSCPIYAAQAGLIWILEPGFSAQQVINHLGATSFDLGDAGYDKMNGHGTPKYGSITKELSKPDDPGDDPDDPGDDPDAPRKKRDVRFSLADGFTGNWRSMDMERLEEITFYDIEISATSTLPTKKLFAEVESFVEGFFAQGRRSVIVPANWDYDTGIYWFGRFMEILGDKAGLKLSVESIGGRLASGANSKSLGKTNVKLELADQNTCTIETEINGKTFMVPCIFAE